MLNKGKVKIILNVKSLFKEEKVYTKSGKILKFNFLYMDRNN